VTSKAGSITAALNDLASEHAAYKRALKQIADRCSPQRSNDGAKDRAYHIARRALASGQEQKP
jgi:hypothetical protein